MREVELTTSASEGRLRDLASDGLCFGAAFSCALGMICVTTVGMVSPALGTAPLQILSL
jgi:hypothetical protein